MEFQDERSLSPLKNEETKILNLIDSKINKKTASLSEFGEVDKLCEKEIKKTDNPYIWALKGYCIARLGNINEGIDLIIKSIEVAYNKKSKLKGKKYDSFRRYLFENRNLLLCIDNKGEYAVNKILTLGRASYQFNYMIDSYSNNYSPVDRFKTPQFAFIPKVKGKKLKKKTFKMDVYNKETGYWENGNEEVTSYFPIQQFLEENKISQKEGLFLFNEFKELYSVSEKSEDSDYLLEHYGLDGYEHKGKDNGATFLFFLKTICEQIIELLGEKISDLELSERQLMNASNKLFHHRMDRATAKHKRFMEHYDSKPGFWQSVLTDGEADEEWESKNPENPWDDFVDNVRDNMSEGWENYIESAAQNSADIATKLKIKIEEVAILAKSIVVFDMVPIKYDTNKFKLFLENYNLFKQNLPLVEEIKLAEQEYIKNNDFFTKEHNEMAKKLCHHIECKMGRYYFSNGYSPPESSYKSSNLSIYNFEEWRLIDSQNLFTKKIEKIEVPIYNKKQLNTTIFKSETNLEKAKFQNGYLIPIDFKKHSLHLGFSWIEGDRVYPKNATAEEIGINISPDEPFDLDSLKLSDSVLND